MGNVGFSSLLKKANSPDVVGSQIRRITDVIVVEYKELSSREYNRDYIRRSRLAARYVFFVTGACNRIVDA